MLTFNKAVSSEKYAFAELNLIRSINTNYIHASKETKIWYEYDSSSSLDIAGSYKWYSNLDPLSEWLK